MAPCSSKPDLPALPESTLVGVKDVDGPERSSMICDRVLILVALSESFSGLCRVFLTSVEVEFMDFLFSCVEKWNFSAPNTCDCSTNEATAALYTNAALPFTGRVGAEPLNLDHFGLAAVLSSRVHQAVCEPP